jgi:hypothetical protein
MILLREKVLGSDMRWVLSIIDTHDCEIRYLFSKSWQLWAGFRHYLVVSLSMPRHYLTTYLAPRYL